MLKQKVLYNHCLKTAIGSLLLTPYLALAAIPADITQQQWSYTYTEQGQIKTEDGPRTDVTDMTTYHYGESGSAGDSGYLTRIENAAGHNLKYRNYDGAGRYTEMEDANRVVTSFAYTPRGWLSSRTVKSPDGDTSKDATTQFYYDAVGQLICTQTAEGIVTKYYYNGARQRYITVYGASACETNLAPSTTRTIDSTGDLIGNILDNMGNTVLSIGQHYKDSTQSRDMVYWLEKSYDELGRMISNTTLNLSGTNGRDTTQYAYNHNGQLKSMTNPEGHSDTTHYNAQGQVAYTQNAKSQTTHYQYDSAGRLNKVIDPGQAQANKATEYQYNFAGQRIKRLSPETGSTDYRSDEAGNLKYQRLNDGTEINYSYDALNRLTRINYPNNEAVAYLYDSAFFGGYPKGRLTAYGYKHGYTFYKYDHRGNVDTKNTYINNQSYPVIYQYNKDHQITQITYPNALIVKYHYHPRSGKLQKVIANANGQLTTLADNIQWYPFGGSLKSMSYGNGLALEQETNSAYQLKKIKHGDLYQVDLDYFPDGMVKSINNSLQPIWNKSYTYTELNQLKTNTDALGLKTYDYDLSGNLQSRLLGSYLSTFTHSLGKQQIDNVTRGSSPSSQQATHYQYDARGNLTQRGSDRFSYNTQGRLASATVNGKTTTYHYNPEGQRIQKQTADKTTVFIYDLQGNLIAEADQNGTIENSYIYLNGKRLAVYTAKATNNSTNTAQFYYYHGDHLDTPQLLTDKNKTIVWRAYYMPYGETLTLQNTVNNPFRFPGQYHDEETGLYYNYFRYYDPKTGKYITADPIGLEGGANIYSYALQNPINYIDPEGLNPLSLITTVGRVAIGAAGAGTRIKKTPIKPRKDRGKWRCAVVSCCNDNIPGNCPNDPKQQCKQAVWSDGNRSKAINSAERLSKQRLGCQPKHVTVRCTGPKGEDYQRGGK